MDTENKEENPLLDSLKNSMRCGILTKPDGDITIIHDQPLSGGIEWVEYDEGEDAFSLIYERGRIQPLGLSMDKKAKNNLMNAQNVILVHIEDKQTMSSQKVHFIYKE